MGPGDSGEFSAKFLGGCSLLSPPALSFLFLTLGGRSAGPHVPVCIVLIQRFISISHSTIHQEKVQEWEWQWENLVYPYSTPCISTRNVHISVKDCLRETADSMMTVGYGYLMIKVVFNSSSPLPFFLFPFLFLWWSWGSNSTQSSMYTWQMFYHWLTRLASALCPISKFVISNILFWLKLMTFVTMSVLLVLCE